MKTFELIDSFALSVACAKKYNNCAFDGCFYYFTVKCCCQIIKTDCHFYIVECYNTWKEYDCICYDQTDHCFWATTKKYNNAVFKLNCNMCEIDCITMNGYTDFTGDITGISYNCCNNQLVLSYSNCILETNKETGFSNLLYTPNGFQITSVLSLCPGLVISGIYNNEQYMFILNSDSTVAYTEPISNELQIRNILFNPCVNDDNYYLELFVLKKGCYPYIYRYQLFLNELPFEPDECNFNICSENCCEQENCGDPCTSILQSIALVETEIAHILNCEGEKLQKIIEESTDIDVIIGVNKEVNNTICNISQLEYLLYLKLNALVESGICNGVCEENVSEGASKEGSEDSPSSGETIQLTLQELSEKQEDSLKPENSTNTQKVVLDSPTKIKYAKGLNNDTTATITNSKNPGGKDIRV
ncbi:hypothetical protein [Anaerotignum sp.]|uniref:hypothetical protein n=1 Tax=Anaerotignum sp. TaxID=2039241 RepID=UPI002714B7C5|nr:hypothetical protein [Anaerotignum sp.]